MVRADWQILCAWRANCLRALEKERSWCAVLGQECGMQRPMVIDKTRACMHAGMMGSSHHDVINGKLVTGPRGARQQVRELCHKLRAQPDDKYATRVCGTGACVLGIGVCPRQAHPPKRRAAEPSVSADSDGWPRGEGPGCRGADAAPAFAALLCATSSPTAAGKEVSAAPAEPCAAAGAGAEEAPPVGRFSQLFRRRSRAARAASGVRPDASHPPNTTRRPPATTAAALLLRGQGTAGNERWQHDVQIPGVCPV